MTESEISRFLARYAAAFDALDGDAVAALWHTPCGIADARGVVWWTDAADTAANMRALCEVYRKAGYLRAQYRMLDAVPMGADDAFVNVAWVIEGSGGTVLQSFRTGYQLKKPPGAAADAIRVLLCTAYEEDITQLPDHAAH
ncbi:MAG TPA: hypothetical protein VFK82_02140 [Burkholderiaceae bacterium]|nr:hypothetical protein [Burkholderiaceae bacterium]